MRALALLPVLLCLGTLVVSSCTSARLASMDQRQLIDADSLFFAGDFVHARAAYGKLQSAYPSTPTGDHAQFMLGFINVYYRNAFADREAAAREFTKYQTLYPQGKRLDEVNSWLEILHTLRSYQEGYSTSIAKVGQLENRQTLDTKNQERLADGLVRCVNVRDSLSDEIRLLTREIEKLKEFIVKIQ